MKDEHNFCTTCGTKLKKMNEIYPWEAFDARTGEKVFHPYVVCPKYSWWRPGHVNTSQLIDRNMPEV